MPVKGKKRKPRQPTGQIGNQIFEQVESMVASDNISRSEAFRRLSEKSGRKAGTVAANYYRVARKRGIKLRSRPGRPPRVGPGRGRARWRSASHTLAVLNELQALIRAQTAEIDRLRRENSRFAQIRRLLARA